MVSSIEPARRGLVNEVGFRAFAASVETGKQVSELDQAIINAAWTQSVLDSRRERIEARAEREEPAQAYYSYVRRHRSAQPTHRFAQ